jgi:hypothetical protein
MAWNFDAPGGLRDFTNPNAWNIEMTRQADQIIATLVGAVVGKDKPTDQEIKNWAPQLSYVHPVVETVPNNAETIGIQAWGGFPRAVDRRAPWTDTFPPVDGDLDGSLRAFIGIAGTSLAMTTESADSKFSLPLSSTLQ